MVSDCDRARKPGFPVCRFHWSLTPFDLKERLRDARGYAHDEDDTLAARERDDMEYISAQHAIIEYLEGL